MLLLILLLLLLLLLLLMLARRLQYCRNQVANAIREGQLPGVNFVAAGTSPLPGWGTAARVAALKFSLAGFLVAQSRAPKADPTKRGWAAQRDYFGFDHQEPGPQQRADHCAHTRWGDCANRWSEVEATYATDYGVPVSDGRELGHVGSGVFFRQYSKMNLTFDCATKKADYRFFKADDEHAIRTVEDCSLNGRPASGTCSCNPGWAGATCALLDRRPPPSRVTAAIAGSPSRPARPGSTWGGNVLVDAKTGDHHLFVTEIAGPNGAPLSRARAARATAPACPR